MVASAFAPANRETNNPQNKKYRGSDPQEMHRESRSK
jgi:hypothetical protein